MGWTITWATAEPGRGSFRAKAKLTVEYSSTRQQQESQGAGKVHDQDVWACRASGERQSSMSQAWRSDFICGTG